MNSDLLIPPSVMGKRLGGEVQSQQCSEQEHEFQDRGQQRVQSPAYPHMHRLSQQQHQNGSLRERQHAQQQQHLHLQTQQRDRLQHPDQQQYQRLLPARVPITSFSAEVVNELRSFSSRLRQIDPSDDCIRGLAMILLHQARRPLIYHLMSEWESVARTIDSNRLLSLVYVMNDAVQRCCGFGCPVLLQLSLSPLATACRVIARSHPTIQNKCIRVICILRDRDTFGSREICHALLTLLQGSETSVPNVPSHVLGGSNAQSQQNAAHANQRVLLSQQTRQEPCTVIDNFPLQFPAPSDAGATDAADAAVRDCPDEGSYKKLAQSTLKRLMEFGTALEDITVNRQRQEHNLSQCRRQLNLLKHAASTSSGQMSENVEAVGVDSGAGVSQARLKKQIASANARALRLAEKEWATYVGLQDMCLNLASATEERLVMTLRQHRIARELKIMVDTAIVEKNKQHTHPMQKQGNRGVQEHAQLR